MDSLLVDVDIIIGGFLKDWSKLEQDEALELLACEGFNKARDIFKKNTNLKIEEYLGPVIKDIKGTVHDDYITVTYKFTKRETINEG